MNTNTCTPLRTLVAGAILSALALHSAAASTAAQDTQLPQVAVKFGDLDLATSTGAASLYGRIHFAADNVCWHMYRNTRAYKAHKNACLQRVIADAVTRVDRPTLSAVFASKYGLPAPAVLAAALPR